MIVFVLFIIIAIPFWAFAWNSDPVLPWFLWGMTATTVAMYMVTRSMEASSSYANLSRSGLGKSVLAKASAVLIAAVIAWKTWPIQMTIISVVCIAVIIEAHRLIMGWKLFFPVRK